MLRNPRKEKSPLSVQSLHEEWAQEQRNRMKEDIAARAEFLARTLGEETNKRGLAFGTFRYTDYPLSIIVKNYKDEESLQIIYDGECVFLKDNEGVRSYTPGTDWENRVRRTFNSFSDTTQTVSG